MARLITSKQARQAAQALREIAPIKSHEVRRACLAAAGELEQKAKELDVQSRKVLAEIDTLGPIH